MRTGRSLSVLPIPKSTYTKRQLKRVKLISPMLRRIMVCRRGAGWVISQSHKEALGEIVKHRREQMSLSRKHLAWRARVSPTTVYYLETGVTEPRQSTLLAIAAGLGTSLSSLLTEAWGRV